MTQNIKLPPLPQTVGYEPGCPYPDWVNDLLHQYGTDAVELDRQCRGEPVAWFTEDHLTDRSATTYDPVVAERWRVKGWPVSPLFKAPQPAEPVKVPSNEEIIDTIVSYGKACAGLSTATERQMRLHEIRALLARYGEQDAAPVAAQPSVPEPAGEAQDAGPMYPSGTTMALFSASIVPAGTKLYAGQPAASTGRVMVPTIKKMAELWDEHQKPFGGEPFRLSHIAYSQALLELFGKDARPSARDGWKLVPLEPTEEMVVYGFESAPCKHFSSEDEWRTYEAMSGCEQAAYRARKCWDAMLAAAPAPPADGHRVNPTVEPKLETLPVTPEEEEEWQRRERG